jgi:uncharacterized membrane protein
MTATIAAEQASKPVTATATTTTTRVRRDRAKAVGVAALATSLLYLVARALGTDFTLTDPGKAAAHTLVLPEILGFTLVFSLLGWGALAVLERYTRHARAIWSVLAGTVLLLSFVPIAAEHATTDTKVMLTVIHLAVAATLLPMLRHTSTRKA